MNNILIDYNCIDFHKLLFLKGKQIGLSDQESYILNIMLLLHEQGVSLLTPQMIAKYCTSDMKAIDQAMLKFVNERYLDRHNGILDFKPLFTQLKDRFKIVVPEKFGYGQSDIVRENRDYETIVEQYRKALSVLQIKPPYILCAHSLSGHDVEMWAQKYPEEVEAFIGIDANIANCPEINFNYDRLWWEDRFLERFYSITGYVRTADLYGLDKALTKKEVRILKELEVRNTGNYDVYSEEKNYLAAHALINSRPMPTQPTLQFVDTPEWYKDGVAQPHEKGEWDDYEIAWVKAHEDFAAASLNGKVLYYTSGHVMHHYDYVKMAGEIKEFLNAEK